MKQLTLGLVVGLMIVTPPAAEGMTAAAHSDAEYCDFRLYAPAENDRDTSNLLLERADLKEMAWEEENGSLYWKIEVADHARDQWEQVIADSIGLGMAIYCGDELITSPVIRAPLGYEFKVTGMNNDQLQWK